MTEIDCFFLRFKGLLLDFQSKIGNRAGAIFPKIDKIGDVSLKRKEVRYGKRLILRSVGIFFWGDFNVSFFPTGNTIFFQTFWMILVRYIANYHPNKN